MRYLLLLTEDDTSAWEHATEDQVHAVHAAHAAFESEVRRRGSLLAGEALAGADTATTLRTRDGERLVTDGPFAEAAEQIGGFYLVDLPDLDAVVEVCAVLPGGYTTEIRPVVAMEGYEPQETRGG